MSTATRYDIRIVSVAATRAMRALVTMPLKRTNPSGLPPSATGSVLRRPQRFGDSYRWPDGSWTQSG